jgi:transposase-like protein
MRASREEWAKRIERWKDSGLTAEQFAAEVGINANTLKFWRYKVGKAVAPNRGHKREAVALPFVEVTPSASAESRFEVELTGGQRVSVPVGFDAPALERLLTVLERRK